MRKKSAKRHGEGISVQIDNADETEIRNVGVTMYVNDLLFSDDNVYQEDYDPFQKGDIVWFPLPVVTNKTLEIEIHYSINIDGSEPETTDRLDITEAKEWINLRLTSESQLEIVEFK